MKKYLKQLFCSHDQIEIETKSYSPEGLFIVKSIIKCLECEKSFTHYPHNICCHVNHIHAEILKDYWLNKYKHKG